jgi:hypothetical protein
LLWAPGGAGPIDAGPEAAAGRFCAGRAAVEAPGSVTVREARDVDDALRIAREEPSICS